MGFVQSKPAPSAPTTVSVGGVTVATGSASKACFTGPDCTGSKVLATSGVSSDFWKACQNNSHKSLGVQQTDDSTKAKCFNVSSSGEVDAMKTVPWDLKAGGFEVERGGFSKACFTGSDCTGSRVLATDGVGSDFWKACQANGHKSLSVQQSGDKEKATCYNVGTSGESNTFKLVLWDPISVGGVDVAKGDSTRACFTGSDCTGSKILETNGVGGDFWKACQANGHKAFGIQQKTQNGGDITMADCYNFDVYGWGSGPSDLVKTVHWNSTVGGVDIPWGLDNKACFTGPDCTGSKVLATIGVGVDFWKACQTNGHKSLAIQKRDMYNGKFLTKAECFNVDGSGEVSTDKIVPWDLKVGGLEVERGNDSKTCFTESDCIGSRVLATDGVGSDFWKACQANGHKSLSVQQSGDKEKATCYNVDTSGESNTFKTVLWDRYPNAVGGIDVSKGTSNKACFTGSGCTGHKILATDGVGSDFWKACQSNGHHSLAVQAKPPYDSRKAECFEVDETGEKNLNKTVPWDPVHVGGVNVWKGDDTKACYTEPDCNGEKVLATSGVGGDFWKACVANGHKSSVTQRTDDSTKAKCYNVSSSGEVDAKKTVFWEPKYVGGVNVALGDSNKACFTEPDCNGQKVLETKGVGSDFWKACVAAGHKSMVVQVTNNYTTNNCFNVSSSGEKATYSVKPWDPISVGGINVSKGIQYSTCFTGPDCTGEKALESSGVNDDVWKACQANGYKSYAFDWRQPGSANGITVRCYNVSSSGTINTWKDIAWQLDETAALVDEAAADHDLEGPVLELDHEAAEELDVEGALAALAADAEAAAFADA